jgi:hypothetical protein
MPVGGEVSGDHGGVAWGVPQGAWEETGVAPRFEQRGGGGMPESRDGHAGWGQAGPVLGCTTGTLATGTTHGRGSRGALLLVAPGGRTEPGVVARGCPGGAQQSERIVGRGASTVFGTLAAGDMDLEALTSKSGDLEGAGCMQPQSQARDGGQRDLSGQGWGGLEETSHVCNTATSGETVCGLSPQPSQRVPSALEDVGREAAESTGAEAQGSWGEALAVCAVQEVVLQLLCGEQVGGGARELSQQADLTTRGWLSPCALATELKRGNHGLTQWGHEMSPFWS